MPIWGRRHLHWVLNEYVRHYNDERPFRRNVAWPASSTCDNARQVRMLGPSGVRTYVAHWWWDLPRTRTCSAYRPGVLGRAGPFR
jgi:hypothetical protein